LFVIVNGISGRLRLFVPVKTFALVMLGKLIAAAPAAPSLIASRREIPWVRLSLVLVSFIHLGLTVALIGSSFPFIHGDDSSPPPSSHT